MCLIGLASTVSIPDTQYWQRLGLQYYLLLLAYEYCMHSFKILYLAYLLTFGLFFTIKMTIINITATINNVIMTLVAMDPPTIVPIEVELGVLVLVLVYTSVHSEPVIPFSGNISTVYSTVHISTHYTPFTI